MSALKRNLSSGIKWFYKFNYDRKMYRSEAIYDSKQEAKEAEMEKMKEVIEQKKFPNKKKSIYLFEAITNRLDYIHVKKSKNHYTASRQYLRILMKYIKNIPIEEIKKSDIEDILLSEANLHKNRRGNGFYTINAMIKCYKSLFNFIIQNHDLEIKNPCDRIKFYPIDKKIKYIPTDEEINAVLSICDVNQKRLLEFLRDTGARLSEALNLKGKDVTEDSVILYTRKSYNSNLIPRKVPKPICLKDTIFKSEDLIFGQWIEKPKFLSRKIKLLNLKQWGYHNLRHRYASMLSRQGKPIFEISVLLGHTSIQTTQIYLQLLP